MQTESNPISDETLALIKEKCRLRRQYSQIKNPAVKTCINQLQKQVKEDLRVESQASWKKFCNSFRLESDPRKPWSKIKNFLKLKESTRLSNSDKVGKTNANKAQLFAKLVKRHFSIESKHFDSYHFNEVNKFIEDNHKYFYPPEDSDNYRLDIRSEFKLVEDVNPQTLIKLVKFL